LFFDYFSLKWSHYLFWDNRQSDTQNVVGALSCGTENSHSLRCFVHWAVEFVRIDRIDVNFSLVMLFLRLSFQILHLLLFLFLFVRNSDRLLRFSRRFLIHESKILIGILGCINFMPNFKRQEMYHREWRGNLARALFYDTMLLIIPSSRFYSGSIHVDTVIGTSFEILNICSNNLAMFILHTNT
jgi:hypothetical protein